MNILLKFKTMFTKFQLFLLIQKNVHELKNIVENNLFYELKLFLNFKKCRPIQKTRLPVPKKVCNF